MYKTLKVIDDYVIWYIFGMFPVGGFAGDRAGYKSQVLSSKRSSCKLDQVLKAESFRFGVT